MLIQIAVPLGVSIVPGRGDQGRQLHVADDALSPLRPRRLLCRNADRQCRVDQLGHAGDSAMVKIVADDGKNYDLKLSLNGFSAAHDSMAELAKQKAKPPPAAPASAGQRRASNGRSQTEKAAGSTGGFFVAGDAVGLSGLELQRHAVHAIAQARGLGAVVEDMAQMAAAAAAMHFGADHHLAGVGLGEHGAGQRLPEAGPAGAAVVFGVGREIAAGRSRRRNRCPCW